MHNAAVRSDTNPFTFGTLAQDDAFTNRREEILELAADMRNGQDVVVLAPRRYGKTSLVLRAAQEVFADDVLVAYCDLMRTPTKIRWEASRTPAPQGFRLSYTIWMKRLGSTFPPPHVAS